MDLSPLSKVIPNWGAPTLEGFDTEHMVPGERLKGSNRQFVRFYKKKISQVYATKVKVNEKTGASQILGTGIREVEKEFVHIKTPGDPNEVDDFAEDFHKREHWQQYKAFRDGNSAPIGTPIEESSFVSPSIATELRYLGVHTVEQLADASDMLCGQVANGWELREYARAITKANEDNKSLGQVTALKSELEKAQTMIRELQAQMKNVQAAREESETPSPKRGRPRKIDNTEVTE